MNGISGTVFSMPPCLQCSFPLTTGGKEHDWTEGQAFLLSKEKLTKMLVLNLSLFISLFFF